MKFSRNTYAVAFIFFIANICKVNMTVAQEYLRMIDSGDYSVLEIQKEAEKHFENSDKGRGTGWKQYKRWEYNALRMMDENGYLHPEGYFVGQYEQMMAKRLKDGNHQSRNGDFWEDLGPTYWKATSSWNPGVGRVTAFSVDPSDHNHMIVGANTGGVWRSTDGGKNWVSLNDFYSNMTVFSTAIDPKDKEIYYFGSSAGRIYKSFNAGQTWSQIGIAGNSQINKILINPYNTDIVYASSQNSGVYRSDDGGGTWRKIINDNAGYDIEFKPGDPNTLYASGNGFHISEDGGESFTRLPEIDPDVELLEIINPPNIRGFQFVVENNFSPGKVSVPAYPDSLQAKMAVYLDKNSTTSEACTEAQNGAELEGKIVIVRRGNCNFTEKVLRAQSYGALAVIVVNNDAGQPFAMGGGDANIHIPAVMIGREFGNILMNVVKSRDSEAKLQQPKSQNDRFRSGPKMIGVTPANPEIVYILEAEGSIFGGLYKSYNSGKTFERLNHENKNYFGYSTAADDDRGQAPRDMDIAVHPKNENEVHIAGILSWLSLDGGQSFRASSDWIPNLAASANRGYNHADVDIMAFVGDTLYVGTDGGFFRSINTSEIRKDMFEDLSTGLGIRQFYRIGVAQTNPGRISGGSQDNGTSLFTYSEGWRDWLGADGMETFFSLANPDVVYGTSQNGGLYRSADLGQSYSSLNIPDAGSGNWVTPFERDPINGGVIYAGYDRIYKSEDGGNNWAAISPTFPEKLNEMKISPADNNIIYASHNNTLYRTINGGQSWTQLTGYSGRINYISCHPTDPNTVAIATTHSGKVFVSKNKGATWTSYRLNLPDFSALCITWEDNDYNGLYLGTNFGVYYTDDRFNEWILFNNQLPNVIINELEINYQEGKIYAATYGRGLWASNLFIADPDKVYDEKLSTLKIYPNPSNHVVNINWEYDQAVNLRVYDIHGKLVKQIKNQMLKAYQMDISDLDTGQYFIEFQTPLGIETKKIMVVK